MRLQGRLWRQVYRCENGDENWGDLQKKKKKGQRLYDCKNFPLFGLKMTQILELTGDDLFCFGDHPKFRLWFQSCTVTSTIKPATASHRPAFDKKNVAGTINFVS